MLFPPIGEVTSTQVGEESPDFTWQSQSLTATVPYESAV